MHQSPTRDDEVRSFEVPSLTDARDETPVFTENGNLLISPGPDTAQLLLDSTAEPQPIAVALRQAHTGLMECCTSDG